MKKILLMFLGVMTWEGVLGQFTIASDNASNYGGGWTNGSNGGTGFNSWSLSAVAGSGGFAGRFIGNPSSAGIVGMNSSSFALFANPNVFSNESKAFRSFSGGAMQIGDVFSFSMGMNWDAGNSDGFKGIDLRSSSGVVLNFNMGNSSTITWARPSAGAGGNLFTAFGTNAMNFTITRVGTNEYRVVATPRTGSTNFDQVITLAGEIEAFEFYAGRLNGGSDATNREPYYNNLSLTNSGAFNVTSGSQTYSRALSGSSNLSKSGAGTLILTGGNTYTGTTTVSAGTLQLNRVGGNTISSSNNLTVENGATLRISSSQSLNDLIVNTGGTVVIDAGISLTINGALTNNGTITLEASNETTYAQLLTNGSVTGNITVQRAVTGSTQGWRFFSPATSGTQNNLGTGLLFAPGGPANVINLSNGSPNAWQGVGGTTATALTPGRGYGVYFGTDGVNGTSTSGSINTTGSIQTSNVTVSGLTNGNSGSSFGWALVGNPFTAGFNFGDAANTKTNIDNTVWIWNPTSSGGSGAYASYNYTTATSAPSGALNGVIPPTQGFIIKVNNTSPVLTMATAARTTATPNAQMRTASVLNRMYLTATNTQNGFNDELALVSWPTASTTFESDVDALKLNSFTSNAVNFSSKSSDNRLLSINSTSVWNDQLSIPLHIACTDAAAMKIEANLQEVDATLPVILEDRLLNRNHNLRQGAYQFAHVPAQADRFVIHFTALATSVQNNQLDKLLIYSASESLFVKGVEGAYELAMFDMQGRKVKAFVGNSDQEWNISELPKGAYVVHAQLTDGVKSFKVVR